MGYITADQLRTLALAMADNGYGMYLKSLLNQS